MRRHSIRAGLPAAVLLLALIGGCKRNHGGGTPPPPPATPHPLDVKGQDCLGCHEHDSWNFAAMHDRTNPRYDPDCIKCHGTMLDEQTLDPERAGPHTVMLAKLRDLRQVPITNENCVTCHYVTDFEQKSGGDLRRQVHVSWCWGCHKASGPYQPVLYPN